MDTSIIRISDFLSVKSYCELQFQFGKYDYKCQYTEKFDVPIKNMKIIFYEKEEFSLEEKLIEYEFEKDFVQPGLKGISIKYFDKFRFDVQDKVLYESKQRFFYAKSWRDKILEYKDVVSLSEHLDKSIIELLIGELVILEELISEFVVHPFTRVKERIQFNWNKTDIIYFFHLLRLNKTIEWIEDADLGRILDSVFEYSDGEKHFKIDKSRSQLNRFKNIDRPTAMAIKRLKKRLINEDFFNY